MSEEAPILECFRDYPYRFAYGDEVKTEFFDGFVLDVLHTRNGDVRYVLEDEHGEMRICCDTQLEFNR